LAPERVRALVTIGGYNVQNTLAPSPPAPVAQERAYWYQWYFNTERGRAGLEKNRRELCKLLWREWSPTWKFDDAEFERTAPSFDNPDFVPVVIHSYRHRPGNAAGDQRLEDVGLSVAWETTVGDDRESLLRAFQLAGERADAVIVNGGLGPTVDDLSQEVAAQAAGVELALNDEWLTKMEDFFRRRSRVMPPNNRKQAMLPTTAEIIDNPSGTACGFAVDIGHARFFFTPGVPRELKRMLEEQIVPRLLAELTKRQATLAIVETFTSGQIAARFAHLPGAEKVFRRGILARQLGEVCAAVGVDAPVGDTTRETAEAVARAARQQTGATHALAVLIDLDEGADRIEFGGTICLAIATEDDAASRRS